MVYKPTYNWGVPPCTVFWIYFAGIRRILQYHDSFTNRFEHFLVLITLELEKTYNSSWILKDLKQPIRCSKEWTIIIKHLFSNPSCMSLPFASFSIFLGVLVISMLLAKQSFLFHVFSPAVLLLRVFVGCQMAFQTFQLKSSQHYLVDHQ